jgi:hypothetical protein
MIFKRRAFLKPAALLVTMFSFAAAKFSTGGPLDDLAKPMEGRSMRATSTMREGEVRRMGEEKLNPKNPPRGDTNEMSNWDNFRVAARPIRTSCWMKRAGRHQPYLDDLSRTGKTRLGQGRFRHASGFAPAHLLGRAAAWRGGAGRRFFRQLFRPAA